MLLTTFFQLILVFVPSSAAAIPALESYTCRPRKGTIRVVFANMPLLNTEKAAAAAEAAAKPSTSGGSQMVRRKQQCHTKYFDEEWSGQGGSVIVEAKLACVIQMKERPEHQYVKTKEVKIKEIKEWLPALKRPKSAEERSRVPGSLAYLGSDNEGRLSLVPGKAESFEKGHGTIPFGDFDGRYLFFAHIEQTIPTGGTRNKVIFTWRKQVKVTYMRASSGEEDGARTEIDRKGYSLEGKLERIELGKCIQQTNLTFSPVDLNVCSHRWLVSSMDGNWATKLEKKNSDT
ncbi:hypothetical protein C8J56DRAFT_896125 [Mycena floridula]|nr:hypothetical protein C8J56DRAFT_896125 [Mycena floridula]